MTPTPVASQPAASFPLPEAHPDLTSVILSQFSILPS